MKIRTYPFVLIVILVLIPFGYQDKKADRCYVATWNEEILVVRWDGAPYLDYYDATAWLEKVEPDYWQEWFPVYYRYRDGKGVVFYTFYDFDGGLWRIPLGFCRGFLYDEGEVIRREFTEIYVRDFLEYIHLPFVTVRR